MTFPSLRSSAACAVILLGSSGMPLAAQNAADTHSVALREVAAKAGKKCVVTVREGSGVRLLEGTFENAEHGWLYLDQRGKKLLVSIDQIVAISFE